MKTRLSRWMFGPASACLIAVLLLASTPSRAAEAAKEKNKKSAPAAPEPAGRLLSADVRTLPGPKRVVAVGKFDCLGSFRENFGDWDIGGGMAAMLTTALSESEQFIVVERAYLSQVMAEQELKGQKATAESTGPQLGQITGAQLLMYGAITEFGADNSGGGFNIGIGGLPSGLRAGLGPQFTKGKVAMDIRVVDTTTGQILATYKVTEKLKSTSWDVSIGKDKLMMGNNYFLKTPLGEACRRAVTQAVQRFADNAAKQPWLGRVVDIEGGDVAINAGDRVGVKQGDKFQIFRTVKIITDPDTGRVLSRKEKALGTLEVIKVEEALSSGIYVADAGADGPARGDLVRHLSP